MSVNYRMDQAVREVWDIIVQELSEAESAVVQQADALFSRIRDEIKDEVEKPSAKIQQKLDFAHEEMRKVSEQIADLEKRKAALLAEKEDLQRQALGPAGSSPEASILSAIGAARSKTGEMLWHGWRIGTQLDALAAERLSSMTDVMAPFVLIREIREATEREMRMCMTLRDARKVYEEFRRLNLQRLGVKTARTLAELIEDPRIVGLGDAKALPEKKARAKKLAK